VLLLGRGMDWPVSPDPFAMEPLVRRVYLRVEYEDGSVRELRAEHPHSVDMKIDVPGVSLAPFQASPYLIPACDVASVALTFKASHRYDEPMTISAIEASQP
jgi:hypothetical protein